MGEVYSVYQVLDSTTKIPSFTGYCLSGSLLPASALHDPTLPPAVRTLLGSTNGPQPTVRVLESNLSQPEAIAKVASLTSVPIPSKKKKMVTKDKEKYATIQIQRHVKDQILEVCNSRGYKISGFVERLVLEVLSGSLSGSYWSGTK